MIVEKLLNMKIWKLLSINAKGAFTLVLCLIWSKLMVFDKIGNIVGKIVGSTLFQDAFTSITILFLLILSVPYLATVIRKIDIFVYVVVCLVYIINIIVHYNTTGSYLFDNWFQIIIICFGMYYLGLGILEEDQVKMMYSFSLIYLCVNVFYVFAYQGTAALKSDNDISMGYAYNLLPHVCLITSMFSKKPNILNFLGTAIGLLILLLYGTRGPLLIFIVFLASQFIIVSNKYKRLLIILIVCIVAYLFVSNYMAILFALRDFVTRIGASTRIIDFAINGNMADGNGREHINEYILEMIDNNPIFGYGIAGDRNRGFAYAHNILFELWVSYGIPLGTFLLGGYLFIVIKSYIMEKNYFIKDILIPALFAKGFLMLFLSGSYLINKEFFLLLGLSVSSLRYSNHEVVSNENQCYKKCKKKHHLWLYK